MTDGERDEADQRERRLALDHAATGGDEYAAFELELLTLKTPMWRVDTGAFVQTPYGGQLLDKDEMLAHAHRPRPTFDERLEKARRNASALRAMATFDESIPDDLSGGVLGWTTGSLDEAPDDEDEDPTDPSGPPTL